MKRIDYAEMMGYLTQQAAAYIDKIPVRYLKRLLYEIGEIYLFKGEAGHDHLSRKHYVKASNIISKYILIAMDLEQDYHSLKHFEDFECEIDDKEQP